jgi:hypothetical protein
MQIRDIFPHDEANGLYAAPKLPATKLGKILAKDSRIASPSDVQALHLDEGFLSSTAILLTAAKCFYPSGEFLLADVRDCAAQGETCTVRVNRMGNAESHSFKTKNEAVAAIFRKVFDAVARQSAQSEADAIPLPTYEHFEPNAIQWLLLRDEVMKTIDLLFDKFNDGKLSLLEYEEKKADLLARL